MKFYCVTALWVATQSLPSRERGLKSYTVDVITGGCLVAPFAGAWIEIPSWGRIKELF